MKNVVGARLVIKAIEDGFVVSFIVEGSEFRSVEEAASAEPINYEEISGFCIPEPEAGRTTGTPKRSVRCIKIAECSPRPETRAGCDLRDKATFVPKLSGGCAGCRFHTLNGSCGKLSGEQFTLLVANRLSINNEAHLSVIAKRVKKSIGVGGYSTGAVDDRLA